MKRLIFTIILISGGIIACAQNRTIKILQLRLHAATTDVARLSILDSLSMYNMFFNDEPDSTFTYCSEYINKSFQMGDKKHLVLAYARLSFYYTNVGQVKESLSSALKGLDIAEQYHVNEYLSALYYDLAWAYGNLDEEPEALKSAFKGIAALLLPQDMKDSLDEVLRAHGNALDVQQFRFDQQLGQKELAATAEIKGQRSMTKALIYVFVTSLTFLLAILLLQLRNSKHKKKANEVLKREKEKVEDTLTDLRSTQAQLVQREKMASLGELTAGIAHEIQNPLNFVNNFSDVNQEMLDELNEQLAKGDIEEAKAIATDIRENEQKINHHGKRAESIVKGMLEHSRASTGKRELTDLNALADEYLRLAYHGLRAKDKSFQVEMITEFAKKSPKQNVISQDMGRVFLNLFINAFYAVNQKSKTAGPGYKPVVELRTSTNNEYVEISVKDNGIGFPDAIKEKIMQPFFTTKPTGQGTGLGLSLAYDIVIKEHGGTIQASSSEGEGSTFTIKLHTN